jgi:hypothetical protein
MIELTNDKIDKWQNWQMIKLTNWQMTELTNDRIDKWPNWQMTELTNDQINKRSNWQMTKLDKWQNWQMTKRLNDRDQIHKWPDLFYLFLPIFTYFYLFYPFLPQFSPIFPAVFTNFYNNFYWLTNFYWKFSKANCKNIIPLTDLPPICVNFKIFNHLLLQIFTEVNCKSIMLKKWVTDIISKW